MMLAPALRIADRYTLLGPIAAGGMGEVWRARDERLGRVVAVKVLRAEYAADPDFRHRFHAEARHTAALSHPGIAGVFDYGETSDGFGYLVIEYVDGEPLSVLLRREGRLPASRALDIVGQAALALDAAHRAGVVHRDVKPGNLLVRADRGELIVKLTDFGIARAADAAPLTTTGLVLGTAYYVSPEQVSRRAVGPATDIYALGVVAYECLTGRRPFEGDNPIAVAMAHLREPPPPLPGDVPAPVRALVGSALLKDPTQRPAEAAQFGREALKLAARLRATGPVASAGAVGAAPTGGTATRVLTTAGAPLPPAGGSARRRRRVLIPIVILLTTVAILIAAGALLAPRREPRSTPPRTTTPPRVVVDRERYLGRPYASVAAELAALGLQVRRISGSRGEPGTVTNVRPSGAVAPGTMITVTVAAKRTKKDGDEAGEAGDGE